MSSPLSLKADHDGVRDLGRGALPQEDADVALVPLLGVGVADQGEVVERRAGPRGEVVVLAVVVGFDPLVGVIAALLGDPELAAAGPPVGPVEAVVGDARADEVLRVHGAAEELHAVVLVEVHLDVVHLRTVADALEGDSVQLVVRAELGAGELDADVVQDAAAVGGVVATVGAGVSLSLAFAAGDVQRGVAVDDETPPVTAGPLALDLIARHHDRRVGGTHGH